MKKQTANKIVYIDHWFIMYGEPNSEEVAANKLPNGKWLCEIKLPLINQTVKSVSATEINAMVNASEKAYPLINKYLSEHPDVEFPKLSSFRHYEIETDENGDAMVRINSEYRKAVGDKMLKKQLEAIKALEKAVSKITKSCGDDKNLFVQVIDKSFFGKDDTLDDIQRKIRHKMLGETSDWYIDWKVMTITGNHVLAVGYILED